MKTLSKAETFYVDAHANKLSAQQIASDLGVELDAVVERLKASKKKDHFARRDGVVSMTGEQSQADDESRPRPGNSPRGPKNSIHVFDKTQPSR